MRVRGRLQTLASAPADKLRGTNNSFRRTPPGCTGAGFFAVFVILICGHSKLVVVAILDVFRSFIGLDEAPPKLIVDPDRILSICRRVGKLIATFSTTA
jgi:hypothetical protein